MGFCYSSSAKGTENASILELNSILVILPFSLFSKLNLLSVRWRKKFNKPWVACLAFSFGSMELTSSASNWGMVR